MVSSTIVIENRGGLHLRPAGVLCNEAIRYKSKIQFQTEKTTANAKSVLSVLGACIKCGDEVTFLCEGEDEEEALNGILQIAGRGFMPEETAEPQEEKLP